MKTVKTYQQFLNEGAMSELYIIAVESENFDEFINGYREFMKGRNRDSNVDDNTRQWLNQIYQDARQEEIEEPIN